MMNEEIVRKMYEGIIKRINEIVAIEEIAYGPDRIEFKMPDQATRAEVEAVVRIINRTLNCAAKPFGVRWRRGFHIKIR